MEVLYGGKSKVTFKYSLVALLTLSFALSGCGGGNDKNAATTDKSKATTTADSASANTGGKVEPFKVSAFIGVAGQQPTPDNKIYKKIKEETGASFDMEFLAGDINQKLGVMIAGQDYPTL